MRYNRGATMRSANIYARVMPRSDALRMAWRHTKARSGIQAACLRPDEMRPGDNVAIRVGALWGAVRWYPFTEIAEAYGEHAVIASFDVGPEWPPMQYVLPTKETFVAERGLQAKAASAAR